MIADWFAGKLVWLAVIGALLAALMFQQVRVSNARGAADRARAELADVKTRAAQAAQKAEQDARAEEQRRESAKQEVIDEANKQTAAAQVAARTAAAGAERLREQLARYVAAARAVGKDSAAASSGASASDAIGVLADVFRRTDDRAGILAAGLDASRVAGLACERAYDSLTVP